LIVVFERKLVMIASSSPEKHEGPGESPNTLVEDELSTTHHDPKELI
jgi:hypothetical protein